MPQLRRDQCLASPADSIVQRRVRPRRIAEMRLCSLGVHLVGGECGERRYRVWRANGRTASMGPLGPAMGSTAAEVKMGDGEACEANGSVW